MSVARLYAGQVDVDPLAVVSGLVADEHVPAQAAARYKPSGRKKRAEWERTWDLQRAEDRGEDVGRIAVRPSTRRPTSSTVVLEAAGQAGCAEGAVHLGDRRRA